MKKLCPVFLVAIAGLALVPVASRAQSAEARETCRQAARILVNQETRWRDGDGRKVVTPTIYWQATDGTEGLCRLDGRARVYEVTVEKWGRRDEDVSTSPGGPGPRGQRELIRCESDRSRRKECPIPTNARVEVFDQLSNTACVQRRNWGYTSNAIWVDDGCRAVFEVTW